MMLSLPKYDCYKDSGVDWLGEIPAHWEKWKISHLLTLGRGRVIDKSQLQDNGLYPVYSSQTKDNGIFGYLNTYDFQGDYITWTTDGANAGTVSYRTGQFNCTNVCGTLKPSLKNFSLKFVAYLLNIHTPFYVRHDINPKLMNDVMSKINIYLPPLEEQEKIVKFLDKKCEEVEKSIELKQRLITLLDEQKSIVINQAVTKGLNPHAPMKDSGIDWLGDIPAHWEVKRAKYLLKEVDERSQTGKEELLSVSHVTGVTPRSEKNVNMFMAEDYTGSKLCRENDLVINIMWAWMGALGVSNQLGIISSSYAVFRQKKTDTFNAWFLEHLLRSTQYVAQYNRVSTGLHSSRLRLYADTFLTFPIIFPTKQEQDLIEKKVREKIAEIEELKEKTLQQIEKLKEFKQILIAEAVTGEIKV